MFSEAVTSIFAFLKTDFDFQPKVLNERSVQFERGDSFVRVSHSPFDEVELSVGTLRSGIQKSFGVGALLSLTSGTEGFAFRDRIASKPEHVEQALRELANVLKIQGKRILDGDSTVFAEMQHAVDDYWASRNAVQIRQRAEAAFAAKDFAEALKQYRLLGESRKPLDSKRMEMCERLQP